MAARTIPLGEPTDYADKYTPSLLFAIERAQARAGMGLDGEAVPFRGEDVWTGFELTWLNDKGKPQVGGVQINVPCNSTCVVESKSLKLYLNSFAQSRFNSKADLLSTLNSDLAIAFRAPVMVQLMELGQLPRTIEQVPGTCLDGLDVEITDYSRNPTLLALEEGQERAVKETLHSNLFRSLCPVTGQPDLATIIVQYLGRPLVRAALLQYLISFRCHQAFHETVIEQIFLDIKQLCGPEQLSVHGRFQRRGGIDINPFRSDSEDQAPVLRLPRQ